MNSETDFAYKLYSNKQNSCHYLIQNRTKSFIKEIMFMKSDYILFDCKATLKTFPLKNNFKL